MQHEPGGSTETIAFDDPIPHEEAQPDSKDSLKFHLPTYESHRGYIISINPSQVDLLNRLVTKSGLCQTEATAICNFIVYDNKSRKLVNLTKKAFDNSMQRIFTHAFRNLPGAILESTKQELSSFSEELFTVYFL